LEGAESRAKFDRETSIPGLEFDHIFRSIHARQVKNNFGRGQRLSKFLGRIAKIILIQNHISLLAQRHAQVLTDKSLCPGH
jgi:hypothetical protein